MKTLIVLLCLVIVTGTMIVGAIFNYHFIVWDNFALHKLTTYHALYLKTEKRFKNREAEATQIRCMKGIDSNNAALYWVFGDPDFIGYNMVLYEPAKRLYGNSWIGAVHYADLDFIGDGNGRVYLSQIESIPCEQKTKDFNGDIIKCRRGIKCSK